MIEVNNLSGIRVKEKRLEKIVRKVLKEEKVYDKADLSVALVGEARIQELNKNYRRKNRSTDVLSFGKLGKSGNKNIFHLNSAEIIICPQIARKNAKKNNATLEKELTRILIHGVLHVIGYDHERNMVAASKMQKKENFYLSKIK